MAEVEFEKKNAKEKKVNQEVTITPKVKFNAFRSPFPRGCRRRLAGDSKSPIVEVEGQQLKKRKQLGEDSMRASQ
ncbi:hypothetical protein HAX54_013144, partial [Datura stramonium]|nr:hypothetical protein [Datura stramonium]